MEKASFQDALVASAAELGSGPDAFRPLDDAETSEVVAVVERAFGDVANGTMGEWWPSVRPCPRPSTGGYFHFHEGNWWRHLTAVAPIPAAPVWLLARNEWGDWPSLFAFESTAEVVQAVLGHALAFEYIVCGRGLDWLFAVDFNDCVWVAGHSAVERLARVIDA